MDEKVDNGRCKPRTMMKQWGCSGDVMGYNGDLMGI